MNDRLLDYAIRIQSIAQAGLQYGKDKYDRERYKELRQIAAEMLSQKTEIPMEKVRNLFCNETGYQTPKIDTRAAGAAAHRRPGLAKAQRHELCLRGHKVLCAVPV